MVCDEGPAVAGYGDIISSSAAPGYWYSLYTKFKQNYNWRISAVLKKADVDMQPAKAAAAAGVTYNVYRNGALVEEGVTDTTFTVANAAQGAYTVTAVTDLGESAESNAVNLGETSGIAGAVEPDAQAADGMVYGIDGQVVNRHGDTQNLKKGVYILNGKKFVVK